MIERLGTGPQAAAALAAVLQLLPEGHASHEEAAMLALGALVLLATSVTLRVPSTAPRPALARPSGLRPEAVAAAAIPLPLQSPSRRKRDRPFRRRSLGSSFLTLPADVVSHALAMLTASDLLAVAVTSAVGRASAHDARPWLALWEREFAHTLRAARELWALPYAVRTAPPRGWCAFYWEYRATWATWAVAGANQRRACRFAIDDRVVDATAFVMRHPGSPGVLLSVAGVDVSHMYRDVGHSLPARAQLEEFVAVEARCPDLMPGSRRCPLWVARMLRDGRDRFHAAHGPREPMDDDPWAAQLCQDCGAPEDGLGLRCRHHPGELVPVYRAAGPRPGWFGWWTCCAGDARSEGCKERAGHRVSEASMLDLQVCSLS